MKKNYAVLTLLIAFCQTAFCQEKTDTAGLIKELKKVMDFGAQPYLYYTTLTKMESTPVLEAKDTASAQGVFYKNGTDFYYKNGAEETYLQDSLMIQLNHERKTIWVSRVDKTSKEKLGSMSVGNKQLQELMRKNYTIQQTTTASNLTRLSFASKQVIGRSSVVITLMGLEYAAQDHLPIKMEVEMHMQQPADDELVAQIKNQGVDDARLIQTIGDQRYLIRSQKLTLVFKEINNTKEKAAQMPLWQQVLDFDASEQKYSGQGVYAAYEITKTF